MIVKCNTCYKWFNDEFRTTICPHGAFNANDGHNNFAVHEDSYISSAAPGSPHERWHLIENTTAGQLVENELGERAWMWNHD